VGDVSTPDRDVIPDEEPAEFGFGGGAWEWETRGIGGGGAFLAASINPHDPNDFSISTDMGMNFRSVDFGRSWFGMHFQTLRGSDRATLRWTADPQQVYTIDQRGWDGAFLIRSIDAGRSWDRVPTDPTDSNAHWVHVDPTSTERVLVASRSEVFFSSDGGATWQTVYSAPEPEHGVYVAGVSWAGDTIVVGISDVMVVSVDGGASWQPLEYFGLPEGEVVGSLTGATAGETRRIWVVSRASGSVWPGIRGDQYEAYSGVWRMDMGPDALFTQVATDLPRDFFPFTVAAAQFDISRVFLGGGDRGTSMPDVYRSDDGGMAWTATFGVRRNVNIATGWCGHRGDVDYWWSGAPLTFEVSPTDSNILIMGDYGFVHVSADGGDTWRQAYVAEADQNPPGQSTPKGRAYRGIGIEDTSSWWLHWTDQSTMFAAYSDIRGISSADAGERWSSGLSAGLPHNSTYHVVSHGPSGRLYGATSSVHDLYQSTHLADERIDVGEGHIVFSEDGGGTWDQISDMGHPVVWLSLDPTSENRLYASVVHSNEGGIYVTDDITASSVTWTRLPSPARTEGHPFNVRVLRDGTIVTTWSGRQNSSGQFTDSSGVFVSEDGGATWSDRSHADMRLWTKDIVIDPHDVTESTWYVSVFSHWGRAPNEIGGIFRTVDRGETWHRISDLYRVESVSIDPNDADLMYVATETNGLWQSSNARSEGPGFVQVLTYPFEHPTRVFFNPFDPSEVWSTSFGGGLRVLSREELGVRL
jgi:photosystem II stability/assembly factor-like uncharacterized protein